MIFELGNFAKPLREGICIVLEVMCFKVEVGKLFMERMRVSILGLVDHAVSVTIQLCHCGVKVAIDKVETNEQGCIPIKLY